jgi:conjugal transfer pilus assembly protein TraF
MKKSLLYRLFVVLGDYESSPYAKAKRFCIVVSLLAGLLLFCFLAFGSSRVFAQSALNYPSAWKCDEEKFHWYCDEQPVKPPVATGPEPKKTDRAAKPSPPAQPRALKLSEIETAAQLREELKRREDIAVMQPTAANIKSYLELNTFMQSKSSDFADSWRRVVWQNPAFDYSLVRPTNNAANRTFLEAKEKQRDTYMANLAKEHGLLFFFRSDCPYCQAMEPVLRMLQEKFGIDVLAVSVDGRGLPNGGKWKPNTGQFEALLKQHGLDQARVPALFVASKITGETAPIGLGQMAYTDIIERIFTLTGTKVGEEF